MKYCTENNIKDKDSFERIIRSMDKVLLDFQRKDIKKGK